MARRGVGRFALDLLVSVPAWLLTAVITCFFCLLITGVYLVHPWLDPRREILHRLAMAWGRLLVAASPGVRVEVEGAERLPKAGPFVLMANHQSYTDIPILYTLGGNFKWVALEILFKVPVLGWAMRMCGYISIPRHHPRGAIQGLERAKRWLDQGISIFIFPEGTRSRVGAFGLYQMGAFRLAVAARVPIIPVVLVGTRQFLPRGGWVFRFGVRPKIVILPAIPPPARDVRALRRLNKELRSRMMAEYRKRLPEFR